MAFKQAVRQEALIKSARHCCVCHRYKGVKVEVHHIVPEIDGGSDESENAIVLCFDCHADAGHYNPNHPRGSKFSPDELRCARDQWYQMVQSNGIRSPETEEYIYVRYLVCKNFSALSEIVAGDLTRIPASHPLLVENSILTFFRSIVGKYKDSRNIVLQGDTFPDDTVYREAKPTVRVFERSSFSNYPYFRSFRVPNEEEIKNRVVPFDPISGILLDSGVIPRDVCWVLGYDDLCGEDGGFQEIYRLREFWAVFLELRNISSNQISLQSLIGFSESGSEFYRSFSVINGENERHDLPSSPLLPGDSALIPLAGLLAPIDQQLPSAFSVVLENLARDECQELAHVDYSILSRSFYVLGPSFWPTAIAANLLDSEVHQDLHELDLSNLYTLDRYWLAGSCPHLFFQYANGVCKYVTELFSSSPNHIQSHLVDIPKDVVAIVVAELENEETTIDRIEVNGRVVLSKFNLILGDSISVPVKFDDLVVLVGKYTPLFVTHYGPLIHNRKVWEFIHDDT